MRCSRFAWLAVVAFALAPRAVVRAEEGTRALAHVKILGFNDFHGQLGTGRQLEGRPVGSAAVLAAYLRDASARARDGALIVHGGDFVGSSPHASSLLQDEPSIAFLNRLANEHCGGPRDARCNVVGTLGNHEFDEGVDELLRLLRGGTWKGGPFLEDPFRGARAAYVCANVLEANRDVPLLPAYVIREVGGVRIGVIGAVLKDTANFVLSEGLRGARFVDEATAINRAARELSARGVRAIVLSIHQGAGMIPYAGATRRDVELPADSELAAIVRAFDPVIDVVVSGHAHQFTNAYVKLADGHEVLVTQAHLAGMAYSEIDLAIDRKSGEVVEKSARILPTFADEGPGLQPASDVAALVRAAEERAASMLAEVLGHAPKPLSSTPNRAGEAPLGNWLADAQRFAMDSQIAFVNQGGIRGDLPAGPITLGMLLAVQPLGRTVMAMDLTGAQLREVLRVQWEFDPPRVLQVSGLTYRWDAALPPDKRALTVRVGGEPLDDQRLYRVAVSDYLARGGGGFRVFADGVRRVVGPRDIDALRAFIAASQGVLRARREARIVRRD